MFRKYLPHSIAAVSLAAIVAFFIFTHATVPNASPAAQAQAPQGAMAVADATAFIRKAATNNAEAITLTKHAEKRMAERGITLKDINIILTQGEVKDTPRTGSMGDFTYKVDLAGYTGPLPDPKDDTDGTKSAAIKARKGGSVVVALPNPESQNPRLVVVTVMWDEPKKD